MWVEAQQLIAAAWLVIGLVVWGWGLLVQRFWEAEGDDLWLGFWVGWAALLSGLQIWHCFLPVDDRARAFFAVIGFGGLFARGLRPWRQLGRGLRRDAAVLPLFVLFGWWLSNRVMAGPRFGDTGMYLMPTVHWYESFAAVPGLANLFVPLGHNLSYFLYVALVDAGPFARQPYPLVNSVLVLAVAARAFLGMARLVRGSPPHQAADLFYALSLIPLLELSFGIFLTSPAPDTAVFLMGLVLAGELIGYLALQRPDAGRLLSLLFVAAAGLTVKLSLAGLAAATVAIAFVMWLWRASPRLREALRVGALAMLLGSIPVGTWMIRNVITSGGPLYPSKAFSLPVDWVARVDAIEWIQRPMSMAPWSTLFSQWRWWQTRLISLGWSDSDVLRPLYVSAAAAALFVVLRSWHWWRGRPAAVPALVLLAPIASFLFCFANTPMPRYQGATLWVFGLQLIVLAVTPLLERSGRWLRGGLALLILAAALSPLTRGERPWLWLQGIEGSSAPRVSTQTLASGLQVNVPENHVCWYAPLPCTPEPHPRLRLRRPGDLSAGFAIDPQAEK